MIRLATKLLLTTLLLIIYSAHAQPTTIRTANGLVSGTEMAGVHSFKGIPFAAPPVGNLRWKAPQPAQDWTGVRACTKFSASPIQPKPVPFYCWTEEFIAPPEPLSEDCLYLNVWTTNPAPKAKKPVFVWIYGGGFSSGSAACAIYDGTEMAKQGVVFVSLNYRVGILGFMAHPELTKEAGTSGNYGILDQIMALKWVQQNIAAFGGDPNNVTIAGQSAGSMSVNCLVASPQAKGLFHKAIAESGSLLASRIPTTLADAEKSGTLFQQKANAQTIADLRKLPADSLPAYSQRLMGNVRFGVNLDGQVLPADLLAEFKQDKQNDVPLLLGWVTGDDKLFGDLSKSVGYSAHVWAGYNQHRTYMYQFSHVPPDKPNFPNYGAFHTAEVPYALHTLHEWKRPWQPLDRQLENTMSAYWVNFAKTGDPNGKGLPTWPSYDKQSGVIMELGDTVQPRPALFKKEFDAISTAQK